ncbi:bifunctional demethylmenaquinone methyltransferase/2-methoxy-6-polyprenyl-1,4-benzoquinol methylase UbiE [Salinibacter altiplanensis]|uniref:bifunctional demethylmenaquinone methyltransferase/2-methoxy-6-polyprenyl-1,4-benzoquinol methylase UbiE n=1 Tax=Salinibacter altiplanensis TaxID=1803181 RepID=UPI000C9FEC71|nr:bifunctional demethylmenaquinone methyltransferase/2-methoxy-6-polyprenyl-1,4-benzoquinol methylase UbiE [Salinibacter altiplanensis]
MSEHAHPPIGEAEGKAEAVETMFDAVAPRYDLLNRVLSAGIDRYWRSRAVRALRDEQPRHVLDVATGTADLALKVQRTLHPRETIGIDLSARMLDRGREKIEQAGLASRIVLQKADAADLPFGNGSFDAAFVAFGVRNFEDLDAGLGDIRRVLGPDGTLVVLEFSTPRTTPIKQLYAWYSRHILPRIGGLLSPDQGAYEYLPSSVAAFPDGVDFLRRMDGAGFVDLTWTPLTFGIASLYTGRVPRSPTTPA